MVFWNSQKLCCAFFIIFRFAFFAGDVDSLSAGNAGHITSHCDCLHMKCLLILITLLYPFIAVTSNYLTDTKTWFVLCRQQIPDCVMNQTWEQKNHLTTIQIYNYSEMYTHREFMNTYLIPLWKVNFLIFLLTLTILIWTIQIPGIKI